MFRIWGTAGRIALKFGIWYIGFGSDQLARQLTLISARSSPKRRLAGRYFFTSIGVTTNVIWFPEFLPAFFQ